MTVRKVIDLPISGAGCGLISISSDGVCLNVEITDGQFPAGTLSFKDIYAFRFRDEMRSLGFSDESYDTVIEIADSSWVRELLEIEPKEILGSAKGSSHFAVFLSNNGYLEVVAESVELQARSVTDAT